MFSEAAAGTVAATDRAIVAELATEPRHDVTFGLNDSYAQGMSVAVQQLEPEQQTDVLVAGYGGSEVVMRSLLDAQTARKVQMELSLHDYVRHAYTVLRDLADGRLAPDSTREYLIGGR